MGWNNYFLKNLSGLLSPWPLALDCLITDKINLHFLC